MVLESLFSTATSAHFPLKICIFASPHTGAITLICASERIETCTSHSFFSVHLSALVRSYILLYLLLNPCTSVKPPRSSPETAWCLGIVIKSKSHRHITDLLYLIDIHHCVDRFIISGTLANISSLAESRITCKTPFLSSLLAHEHMFCFSLLAQKLWKPIVFEDIFPQASRHMIWCGRQHTFCHYACSRLKNPALSTTDVGRRHSLAVIVSILAVNKLASTLRTLALSTNVVWQASRWTACCHCSHSCCWYQCPYWQYTYYHQICLSCFSSQCLRRLSANL